MANDSTVAELILKIMADSSEVRKALGDALTATKQYGYETNSVSKQTQEALKKEDEANKKAAKSTDEHSFSVRMLSRNLTMLGALMSGPIIGALAVAAKTNGQVSLAMTQLSQATKGFSEEIAVAALPVVRQFTSYLQQLNTWFRQLNPQLKSSVVNFLLVGGAILIVLGVLTKLIAMGGMLGKVFNLAMLKGFGVGILAALANPLTYVLLALSIFAVAWIQNWGKIQENTIKILGFLGKQIDDFLATTARVTIAIGLLATGMGWTKAWDTAGLAVDMARAKLTENGMVMQQILRDMGLSAVEAAEAIKKLFGGGGGEGAGQDQFINFFAGFKEGLLQLQESLKNFGAAGVAMAQGMASAMSSAFSDFFFDMFTGEIKTAKEYIESFGKSILRLITNLIAQILVLITVTAILNAIPGGTVVLGLMGGIGSLFSGKKHEGGIVGGFGGLMRKAHEGLSVGEVPIIAQQGEGILSRNGMASIGGKQGLDAVNGGTAGQSGQTIIVHQAIQAWDASDVYRNRHALSAAIIEEIKGNGKFRQTMNSYR